MERNSEGKLSDRELVTLALSGEPQAYSALTERYRGGVTAYISELFAGMPESGNEMAEEPEDICQETFQRAFSKLKEFNPAYGFSTWIYTIARNIVIDYSRKRQSTIAAGIVAAAKGEKQKAEIEAGQDSPEEKMISAQEYSLLIRHIDNLPETYREIAVMRFINEYAYQEIAQKLNLPLNSIKTRVRRAKILLSKLIEQ